MVTEWTRTTLREAGITLIDCEHRTPAAAPTGYPYIAIPQLREGRLDLGSARRITKRDLVEWTRKAKPQEHDVILSRRCNPGETAVVPAGLECALGQNLVLLRACGRTVHPPFLRWLVRGPEWWEQVKKFLNVGAVFDSLRCADVPNFSLSVPPLYEQQAIASILGALDDKIELNRRMNQTLEEMAQAIFKSWFVDFEGHTEFEESEVGRIPKGWRPGSLGDVIDLHDSKRVPLSSLERDKRRGPYPYYGAASVMDHVDDYLFDGVFVLMGEDGSVIDDAGYPIVQYVWGRFWVNNHAHVLTGRGAFSQEQLLLFLRQCTIRPFVTGAVQPKLNQKNLRSIPLCVPPDSVCGAFEDIVQPLFARLRANSDETETLAEIRDTLLPKLISGEIRVPEAEKLVENVA